MTTSKNSYFVAPAKAGAQLNQQAGFPLARISANFIEPEYFSLPLKGEELDKLALMRLRGND